MSKFYRLECRCPSFIVWNVDVQFQYHLTVSLTTHIVCLCVGSSVRDLHLLDHQVFSPVRIQKKKSLLVFFISSIQQWPVKTCRCLQSLIPTVVPCQVLCRLCQVLLRVHAFVMVARSEVQSPAQAPRQRKRGVTGSATDHPELVPAAQTRQVQSLSGSTRWAQRKLWIGSVLLNLSRTD